MGSGTLKNSNSGEESDDQAGEQLYVSLKMENYMLESELIPHVFGSASLVASWDSSNANGSSISLELDLKRYVVPSPATFANSSKVYLANMAKTPRSMVSSNYSSSITSHSSQSGGMYNQPTANKEMEAVILDTAKACAPSTMLEMKSLTTVSPTQKQESQKGLFVDRGVGSPRVVKSTSAGTFVADLKIGSESKSVMPIAVGAVTAAAVADQVLGPKKDRYSAIVLVGLPARGKTFTAAKLISSMVGP